jgi:UDP-glucose 4-epimerase
MKSYDVAIIGAGFVGSSLAKHLTNHFDIVTFDVEPNPLLLKDVDVEHRVCDIRHYAELREKLGKPEVVIHTAIIQIPAINEMKKQAYEVNVLGTHNVCEVVKETEGIRALILTGSWHVFGERDYKEIVDISFGYRPDKVEERARLYVISKMLQEGIVRFYATMVNEKTYTIIRLGTVLGENMPAKTAANLFITNGLQRLPLTPYKHTMYRPMLYLSIDDLCIVLQKYINKILNGELVGSDPNGGIYNLFYPKPITIIELAETVKEAIRKHTLGKIVPKIEIVDKNLPILFRPDEKYRLNVDISKTLNFFEIKRLKNPREAIFDIVRKKIQQLKSLQ